MDIEQANISVVIPCYKCQDTIERAVTSVVRQTLSPLEVILVEDASNDGTLEFLEELHRKYTKQLNIMIVASEKNLGAGAARNLGLDLAKGEYIAFLDADDSWSPNKLEIQYHWMKQNPDVEITGHERLVVEGDIESSIDENSNYVANEIKAKAMLFKTPFSTPTVMMKNNSIYRFPSIRFAEDYGLWLDIVLSGGKCYKINSPLAIIYKAAYGSGGLSSHLLKMELGVQTVYKSLLKKRKIGLPIYLIVSMFSWLKFLRRVLLSKISK